MAFLQVSDIGQEPIPNSACLQHAESRDGKARTFVSSLLSQDVSTVASPRTCENVSNGWWPDRILNCLLGRPSRDGIAGANKPVFSTTVRSRLGVSRLG